MDDRKSHIIATSILLFLIIVIFIARFTLKQSNAFFLILGADLAAILALISLVIFRLCFRRRSLIRTQMSLDGRELRIEYSFLRKVAGVPTKFRFKELEEATDGFTSLIGRGSSASVFKGVLRDGTLVAVKRIEGEEESGEREFKSEVAAVASAQHLNLVRLIGYCCAQNGPRFLVYDFIPNGSLDKWIFPGNGSAASQRGCLSWDLRCRVAIDVARALSYLHNDCRSRILHLDVKPENILLDEDYSAIVSDFGLSKKMKWDQSRVLTTIRGTKGYLAPEWLLENGISEKSDIFSYGMVLLEIIGGRRNVSIVESGGNNSDRKFEYFPKIVSDKLRAGGIMQIVDERLIGDAKIDEKEVKKLVFVALWCIQERVRLRPNMAKVVEMLEGRVMVEEPPETQMVIVDVLSIDDENNEYGKKKYVPYARDKINCDLPSTSISRSLTMPIISGR